jgi:hypothetical protein
MSPKQKQADELFAELDAILDDPMFDGENIFEMTAEQLHEFARRRVARAKTEQERQQAKEDNGALLLLAQGRAAR